MITLRRLGIATALALTATAAPSIPVGAATTAVSGTFVFDAEGTCHDAPAGFDDFTFVISGDLEGCWYTNVGRGWDLGPPSGLYFEVGREVFVGTVRGGPEGTFSTTYTFESRWDPELHDPRHGDLGTVPAPDRPRQRHRRVARCHRVHRSHRRRHRRINDGTVGRYRGFVRQS